MTGYRYALPLVILDRFLISKQKDVSLGKTARGSRKIAAGVSVLKNFNLFVKIFPANSENPNFEFRTRTLGFHREVTIQAMMPEIQESIYRILVLEEIFSGKLNLGLGY